MTTRRVMSAASSPMNDRRHEDGREDDQEPHRVAGARNDVLIEPGVRPSDDSHRDPRHDDPVDDQADEHSNDHDRGCGQITQRVPESRACLFEPPVIRLVVTSSSVVKRYRGQSGLMSASCSTMTRA